MTTPARYLAALSHEFEAGPSGPARAYWNIARGGKNVMTACVHPGKSGELAASSICWALDEAFAAGTQEKAREIKAALGL